MFQFKNKVIYIKSHEEWGLMRMSKQNYAIALAEMGNEVYFINFPDRKKRYKRGSIIIEKTEYAGLYAVSMRKFQPEFINPIANKVLEILTWFLIKRIEKKTKKPDVIIDFDLTIGLPLRFFTRKALKIYFPVDGPFITKDEIIQCQASEIVVTVTSNILNFYKDLHKPILLIGHGLLDCFINSPAEPIKEVLNIGFAGSLVRGDLDYALMLRLFEEHPQIKFHLWGENNVESSTIHLKQDIPDEVFTFHKLVNKMENVQLYGPVNAATLSSGFKKMDALFVIYNIPNDPNNHHKILEYLASGRPFVSTYMIPYAELSNGLFDMVKDPYRNDEFMEIFSSMIRQIETKGSIENQKKRVDFAANFTYNSRIKQIENFINEHQA